MKTGNRIICCIIGTIFFGAVQAQKTYTLRQCIDTALARNIAVQQNGLQADRAAVRLNQAKMNMLPDLNGSFSYGWNQGRVIDPFTNTFINQQLNSSSVGLSSGVTLFSGFQQINTIKQQSYAADASQLELQQARENLTLNVLLSYLQVLSNEDLAAIATQQAAVTAAQVARLEVMVQEGAIGQFQLSDMKGQLASDQVNLVNNRNAVQAAKLSLCQLMNIPYDKDMRLDRSALDVPAGVYALGPDEVYAEAMEKFAQVRATAMRMKSAEKGVKVQRGAYYPFIGFGASLSSNYSSAASNPVPGAISEVPTGDYVRINNTQLDVLRQQQDFTSESIKYGKQLDNNLGRFFGFNAQVPLFNNLRTRNNVRLAKIDLKDAELEYARTLQLLRQNIEQAWLNMQAGYDRYLAYTGQLAELETSFRAAEIRFNNGVINSVEYLLSKNAMDRARVNLTQSTYEYIFRMRILDFYRGLPVG